MSRPKGFLVGVEIRYLLLFVLSVVANAHLFTSFAMINDEGVTVYGAQRWLQGQWPYSHFETRHTPGSYALTAAFFAIFGDSQMATRLLMLLLAGLQGLLVFHLSSGLKGSLRYAPWACWTAIGLLDFPVLGYHWMAILFYTALAAAARGWLLYPQQSWWPRLCGTLLALSGYFLQSEGLAAVLLVGLVWVCWRPAGILQVGLGAATTSAVLWLPFLPVWHRVLQDSVLDVHSYIRFNRHPYSFEDLYPLWQGAKASSWSGDAVGTGFAWTRLLVYTLKYGLYYPVLAAGLLLSWRRNDRDAQLIALATVALTLANLNRQTLEYLAFLQPLWFIVLFRVAGAFAPVLLSLLVVYWGGYLGLWWRDCRFAIPTPAGTYYTENPSQAAAYNKVGEWIRQHLQPGDRALCYPFQPALYALWKLRSPLPQSFLVPLSTPPATLQQAVDQARRQNNAWVIYLPMNPLDCNVPVLDYQQQERHWLLQLTRDLQLLEDFHGIQLYRRIPEAQGVNSNLRKASL